MASQQEQCKDIIVKATGLRKGEQIALSFVTKEQRQSKKVMLHNAKRQVAKSIPDQVEGVTIHQGERDGQYFITISKNTPVKLKPVLITPEGKVKTLDFSTGNIPELPVGDCELPDRIKRLMIEEGETEND